ncbi:MAG: hypothetical protein K2X34_05155 [Hyphomonadaceae bacterium]|nr:hypothetical protein [Hyphomonadaceae bacterium]MBY0563882.1 hypothetical protein [Hyphomonadaceae bacterium]
MSALTTAAPGIAYYQLGGNAAALGAATSYGALSPYLDFINLFQFLLAIIGERRSKPAEPIDALQARSRRLRNLLARQFAPIQTGPPKDNAYGTSVLGLSVGSGDRRAPRV